VSIVNKEDLEVKREGLSLLTGSHDEYLIVLPKPLFAIYRYRQNKENMCESGGMLFARISPGEVVINKVTEPQKCDRRGRYSFRPSLQSQQKIINIEFKKGNHYVGEWHTHPEVVPAPSIIDIKSMSDCFLKSKHQLGNFVMIVIGSGNISSSLWISLHNGYGCKRIYPK
jgi:integrative and conjugative element protein (TIGR02256 family)